jgi:hypothetical protein
MKGKRGARLSLRRGENRTGNISHPQRKEHIMHNASCRIRISAAILAFLSLTLFPHRSCAEDRAFGSAGSTEAGGSITFVSTTPVSNGKTGDAISVFTIAPYIGYFAADGFEIGFNPGLIYMSYGGSSATQLSLYLAPSYNFITDGKTFPFIEGLLGYTTNSSGNSSSSSGGLCWGGRAGLKVNVTGHGLLLIALQYSQITLEPSGWSGSRYGSNVLSVSAGFTVWF